MTSSNEHETTLSQSATTPEASAQPKVTLSHSERAFLDLCRSMFGPEYQRHQLIGMVPCELMDLGSRIICQSLRFNVRWLFIPPSRALSHDQALLVKWGSIWIAGSWGDATKRLMIDAAKDYAIDVAHAAEQLGVSSNRARQMLKDGALGGIELRRGIWRVAPGSIARLIERRASKGAS